jgi:hypothetical protein
MKPSMGGENTIFSYSRFRKKVDICSNYLKKYITLDSAERRFDNLS